jgi:hypothetical protein
MPMLRWWKISRASGVGAISGALALLLLWPVYDYFPEAGRWPFAAALAVTAFCGVSILWITATDIAARGWRNDRIRVVRTFDVVLALLFVGPSLWALDSLF